MAGAHLVFAQRKQLQTLIITLYVLGIHNFDIRLGIDKAEKDE